MSGILVESQPPDRKTVWENRLFKLLVAFDVATVLPALYFWPSLGLIIAVFAGAQLALLIWMKHSNADKRIKIMVAILALALIIFVLVITLNSALPRDDSSLPRPFYI